MGKVYCKVCEKWWRNDKWAWLGWVVHSWVKVTQGISMKFDFRSKSLNRKIQFINCFLFTK